MAFDIGARAAGAVDSAIGQGMGLVFGGIQDKRQLKQQKKLTKIQEEANKRLAEHTQGLQFDMWNKTNYKAQVEHLKQAGLNSALMYGMSGGGGVTTGSASAGTAGGGQADGGSQRTGMGIEMASQLALMKAQKENIEADTELKKADAENKGANTESTGQDIISKKFANELNVKLGHQAMMDRYLTETQRLETANAKELADYEAWQTANFEGKPTDDKDSPLAKAYKAGLERTLIELKGAKLKNDLTQAEIIVKKFEAGLAEEGISPNSPWYVKIVGDLLGKIGLNPIKGVKDTVNK